MKRIIVFITLLLLAACTSDVAPTLAPTATTEPSATSTSTPVLSATPTLTALPTPTASPSATPTVAAALLPRNYRVLFALDKHLWLTDLDAKNVQRITPDNLIYEGFGFEQTNVSPDGRFVPIYNRAMGTWILSLTDQARFRVSRQGIYPQWASDSQAIVYSETGKIYVRELARWDQPRFIATGWLPTWSPDRQWIAFVTSTPAAISTATVRHVHLIHPDGTGLQAIDSFQVGNRASGSIDLQWSHDGHYLLAWGDKPQAVRLWRVDRAGNRLMVLPAINMALSPTGPFLVLDDHQQLRAIRLTPPLPEYTIQAGTWGTWVFDGNRIASFGANTESKSTLILTDLETKQATNVTLNVPSLYTIKWLRGTNLVLVSSSHEGPEPDDSGDIWIVNVNSPDPPHFIAKGIPIAAIMTK